MWQTYLTHPPLFSSFLWRTNMTCSKTPQAVYVQRCFYSKCQFSVTSGCLATCTDRPLYILNKYSKNSCESWSYILQVPKLACICRFSSILYVVYGKLMAINYQILSGGYGWNLILFARFKRLRKCVKSRVCGPWRPFCQTRMALHLGATDGLVDWNGDT